MPIHNWKGVYPGLFHHFQQRWISAISDRMNSGALPAGYWADKPLILASYSAGECMEAFFEPVAVGDVLPDMPLFLEPRKHVPVALEPTYLETWGKCPLPLRQAVLREIPLNGSPRNE